MELYLSWIQRYIWGKISQTNISKPFCINSVFIHSRADIGRSINGLVFFFAGLAKVQVTVLTVLNRRRQGFPATCPSGYCCVCSPQLFASEILRYSPTFNKQRMNKMSPASRWKCYLESQSARWRHVEWPVLRICWWLVARQLWIPNR